jgi:hypothetical protein
MTELRRPRGRAPGSVIDTPGKRRRAREAAIREAGDRLCAQLLAFVSTTPRLKRTDQPTANQQAEPDMDHMLKAPIELRRMETVADVGRALDDVVAAIADGKLSPREGVLIAKIIEARRKAFESIDFKQEIDDLRREVDGERTAKP